MKGKVRGWDRELWGVLFMGKAPLGRSMLLGRAWDTPSGEANRGLEPSRALLFKTRADARAWCAAKNATFAAYGEGHTCNTWKVKPVKVKETVRVLR